MRIGQGIQVLDTRRPPLADSHKQDASEEELHDPWVTCLAELSDIVYLPLHEAAKWLETQGCSDVKPFREGTTDAIGFVKDGQPCLVFRGTKGAEDWLTDVNCLYWGTPARHLGFHRAWALVSVPVISWLRALNSVQGVFLAGHSLGAAVATVAAMNLTQRGFKVRRVVTFGSPRVGTLEFVREYDRLGLRARTSRFEHGLDGICIIPPMGLFAHVADRILLPAFPTSSPPDPFPLNATLGVRSTQTVIADGVQQVWSALETPFIQHLPVLFVFSKLREHFPGSHWANPQATALSRRAPLLAAVLFLCVPAGVQVIVSINDVSAFLGHSHFIPAGLVWLLTDFTTAAVFLLAQQLTYGALWKINAWVRLVLSIASAGLLLTFYPVTQIESALIPVFLLLFALFLFLIYRFSAGFHDHSMESLYARSLRAVNNSTAVRGAAQVSSNAANAKLFKMFENLSEEDRDYLNQAFEKIKKHS